MIVSNPKKPLDKAVEMTRFEYFCRKAVPYVIIVCIIILLILIFIVIVKYGGAWFGTPQNRWEQMGGLI